MQMDIERFEELTKAVRVGRQAGLELEFLEVALRHVRASALEAMIYTDDDDYASRERLITTAKIVDAILRVYTNTIELGEVSASDLHLHDSQQGFEE